MKSSSIFQYHFITGLLFIVLPSCLFASSHYHAEAACRKPDSQCIEQLQLNLDSIMTKITTPGAAVAIVSADSILWIGTFGYANIETGEAITQRTHFCIGSCTKSIVGLGFLKLLDQGRIDLYTPVKEIAPEIEIDNPWADTHPVRVVHLLEHTAGFDDSHPNWFYFKGPVLSLQRALEEKAHLRRVRWQPGTRFSYSSSDFTLAGYILEKVSGQRYEDYLEQNILEPIGMITSTIGSSDKCRQLLAVGYDRYLRPTPVWYDFDEPAGAMNASIKEMALFVQFLLNRGAMGDKHIISQDQFNRIGRPSSTLAAKAGLQSGYSFGFGTSYRGGASWLSHGGAVPGFLAEYSLNLDAGLGYVVLQNSFGISFNDEVFSRVRSFVTACVDSAIPPPVPSVPARVLEEYCGYYEPRNPRLQLAGFVGILTGGVTISLRNDTLYTQGFMEDRTPLLPVTQTLFRRPWHPEASGAFVENSDGRMVYTSRETYFERSSALKVWLHRVLVFGALIIMLSSIIYSLFWVPVHVYRRLKHRDNRSKYIRMRLIPLLAVLSLILGTLKMGDQTLLEFGQPTAINVIFFASTLIFAGLSVLSLFTMYHSFFKSVSMIDRVYALMLSSACLGMTLYLSYWGVIGLRLWAY